MLIFRQEYDKEHCIGNGLQFPCHDYLSFVHYNVSLCSYQRPKADNELDQAHYCVPMHPYFRMDDYLHVSHAIRFVSDIFWVDPW